MKRKINEWSIQLQQNLSENEKNKKHEKKKLETNNAFHQSFENLILKKLVALLLEKHFASAASFQLNGNKAWKKFREASIEIIFHKTMRDKDLHHQLRRDQLDCKDLRSASFRALCPREELLRQQLGTEQLSKEQLGRKQLDKEQLDKEQLHREQLRREQLQGRDLQRRDLPRRELRREQLDRRDLLRHQL